MKKPKPKQKKKWKVKHTLTHEKKARESTHNKHGFCVEKFMLELKRFGYFASAERWQLGRKSTAILAAPTTSNRMAAAAEWE